MVEIKASIDKVLEYKKLDCRLKWFSSYYSDARLAEMAQRQRDIEAEARAQVIAYWEEALRLAEGSEYISLVGQPNELMRISVREGLRRALAGEIETVYPPRVLSEKAYRAHIPADARHGLGARFGNNLPDEARAKGRKVRKGVAGSTCKS
jgi:hypothetical protein